MIGAMHGRGRLKFASILAFPPPADAGPVVAGKGSVRRFSGLPSLFKQLTIARKDATGFEPVATKTRPWTVISRWPLTVSSPEAEPTVQGAPPPLMPRMGFVAPVKAGGLPTIVSNSRILSSLAEAVGADPAKKDVLSTRSITRLTRKIFFIFFSLSWFENIKSVVN